MTLAGFELVYLGEDVPTDQLLRTLTAVEPDVLAVGIPTPSAAAGEMTIADEHLASAGR